MRRVRAVKLWMILVVFFLVLLLGLDDQWYSNVSVASFSSCSCSSRSGVIRERPRGLFPPVSARSEKGRGRVWSRRRVLQQRPSSWPCVLLRINRSVSHNKMIERHQSLQTTTKRKDDGRKQRDEAEESSTRTRSSNQLSHVVYVGNLDWSLTLQECKSLLLNMLSARSPGAR